ncbi:MAG: heme ABC exporter ATP-binding protein CcmA [Actinomycetota bacterium]
MPSPAAIRLHDVGVAFGRTLALDGIELVIGPGVTGVFGPNGSGKSTLLRVIAGLIRPTSGTIALDGRAMNHKDETVRRAIGYAGHSSGLYSRLSLRENLTLFAGLYGVPRERIDATIAAVAMDRDADRPVGELSAGLTRRAAVARALLHDPRILILDEPYANLDDDASESISNAVKSWFRDDRIGLVATHGAKKVRAYAHHGIILQRGLLARAGTYTAAGFRS